MLIMTTTLITGGNGFIGQYVVERLLADGRKVLVLDRHKKAPNGAELFLGDIRDSVAVTEAMAHADSWIHLAGVLGTQETIINPRPAAETNILGGLNVLEGAAQYNLPGVNIAVGNYFMDNTYSITKTTMERFCNMFRVERKLAVTVVRALNAYGPRQSVAFPYGNSKVRKIMPSFIHRALDNEPIQVYGSGEQIMDMIYVADVADVLVDALYYTEENGGVEQVLSAGTGVRTSVLDIANEVINQVGGTIEHLPMRPGEPEFSVVLGEPETLELIDYNRKFKTLAEGVARTVAFYKKSFDAPCYWAPVGNLIHPDTAQCKNHEDF